MLELYCVHRSTFQGGRNNVERARKHDAEQREIGEPRRFPKQTYKPGNLRCLLPVHVIDVTGTAPRHVAESLLVCLHSKVGRCKADCGSFLRTGIQLSLLIGKDEEAQCDVIFHEAYISVLGVVAWTVLTRAELAVYVQALQRRAHAPRIKDCKRFNLVIRHMERYTCGLRSAALQHPFKLVGFTDVASRAQPEEATGLALGGLATTLQADSDSNAQPMSFSGKSNLVDFNVRRQRRAVRSTFGALTD